MYPPADPWGAPEEDPTPPLPPRSYAEPPRYGRASVPVPPAPLREPTAEMPEVTRRAGGPARPVPSVSWHRPSRASMRSLSDGWGFSVTGLIALFCGWGVWAAAGRGTVGTPLVGLILVIVVGAGVFIVCRLLGYLVLQRMMGRIRLHARWSHFIAGLFLTAAGVSYLADTSWIVSGLDWINAWWRDRT
jgi:hypothetical protein